MLGVLAVAAIQLVGIVDSVTSDDAVTPLAINAPAVDATSLRPDVQNAAAPIDPDAVARSSPDAMIRVAQTFAEHARQPDSLSAIRMVDQSLFHAKLRGPQGSAEAVTHRLEAAKVLDHIASRSFESTPGNEALRHWQVLGRTEFRGSPAVLLRYFAEDVAPVGMFDDDAMIERLSAVMTFEEFRDAAFGLYRPHSPGGRAQQNSVPHQPDSLDVFVPRSGYMLLQFEELEDGPHLADLVNLLGQLPLSRSAGKAYLKEWQVFNAGERRAPAEVPAQGSLSIFGEIPGEGVELPMYGVFFRPSQFVSDDFSQLQEMFDASRNVRAVRLCELAAHLNQRSARTPALIQQFRADFPGDQGADMLVVTFSMIPIQPRVEPPAGPWIDDSAEQLFSAYHDPFLLYVQALVAREAGDAERFHERLHAARAAGFQCSEMYRSDLDAALAARDKTAAIQALRDLSRLWGDGGHPTDEHKLDQESTRWELIAQRRQTSEQADAPDPLAEHRRNRPSPFDAPSRTRTSPGTPEAMSPERSATEPHTGAAGMGTVTVLVELTGRFDAAATVKKLAADLNTQNYRMSVRNGTATISLEFDGPLDEVTAAIGFGEVESVDEPTRTVRVRAGATSP